MLPVFVKNRVDAFFSPLRVRLHLLQLRLIRGRVEYPPDDRMYMCLSCGNSFRGNYCNCCGQSSRTARYRFRNSVKTFFEGVTNVNNRFLRTLLELLYRPGYMISDFIRGKRIVYVSPFQGLFLLAALYIIAVQIIDPDAFKSKYSKEQPTMQTNAGKTEMPGDDGLPESDISNEVAFPSSVNPADKGKGAGLAVSDGDVSKEIDKNKSLLSNILKNNKTLSGIRAYINRNPFLQKTALLLNRWKSGNKAFDIILLLPFFSFASFLVFRREEYKVRYNPTEHFYIQTYIACQLLLLSIVILLFKRKVAINDWYEIPEWLIFLIFCLNYKQIFRRDWWNTFWRTLQFFVYILLLVFALAAFVVMFLLLITKFTAS
ncbi:DUF3667 domain-containing protein [Porphyromonas macacae]|uniref:DUF3667 domain-containing protein n=1 Tax=Porphyromonas macacae TaxID=28115 RepID=UPI00068A07CE|nr:DUF3667 domain-containing protein [Porphyromonas macacae]